MLVRSTNSKLAVLLEIISISILFLLHACESYCVNVRFEVYVPCFKALWNNLDNYILIQSLSSKIC